VPRLGASRYYCLRITHSPIASRQNQVPFAPLCAQMTTLAAQLYADRTDSHGVQDLPGNAVYRACVSTHARRRARNMSSTFSRQHAFPAPQNCDGWRDHIPLPKATRLYRTPQAEHELRDWLQGSREASVRVADVQMRLARLLVQVRVARQIAPSPWRSLTRSEHTGSSYCPRAAVQPLSGVRYVSFATLMIFMPLAQVRRCGGSLPLY
jgi:hypothetical protein